MRAILVGAGAVGGRLGRQLVSDPSLERLVVVETDPGLAAAVARTFGGPAVPGEWSPATLDDADVAILASPSGHRPLAELALERGVHVVSVADSIRDVRLLLELGPEARERNLSVVVGAGFAPGLSCVLARHAAADFDTVDEIHVAKVGAGGPACARQHHGALNEAAVDWRDGAWLRRPGGSGRELCWFPDPIGAADCYRGGLPDALLLVPAFPGVGRVTARVAATRRDRLTAWAPMLRKPHPEGLVGAVRVEVRGRRGTARDTRILGALDRPAVAAGAVAAMAASWAAEDRLAHPGAGGLAELVDEPIQFLRGLAERGVRAASFEGAA